MRVLSAGPLLRSLRVARRMSQQVLAERAEVSTRHLSCVETGRALASREMLLILGSALELPLCDRNALLAAAGFAPVYRDGSLDDSSMVHVRSAVAQMLGFHEPHPAILMDRSWNILRMNQGATRLFSWIGVKVAPGCAPNIMRILFDPVIGMRPHIVGFEALGDVLLARVKREVDVDHDVALRVLFADLTRLHGKEPVSARQPSRATTSRRVSRGHEIEDGPLPVVLPVFIRCRGVDLHYVSALTTLGTAHDLATHELRIEGLFAIDDATRAFAVSLAEQAERPERRDVD